MKCLEFKNPIEQIRTDISRVQNLSLIKREMRNQIREKNKANQINKELEIKSRELNCKPIVLL